MQNISTADSSVRGFSLHPSHKFTLPSSHTAAQILRCDVVFGSPKEDCRGTGICRIATSHKQPNLRLKKDCRCAPALMSANAEGTGISLLFRQSDLCAQLTRHYFFQKTCLEIKHSCTLSALAVSALGLKGCSLQVGSHPVTAGDGYYRIDFRLEQA